MILALLVATADVDEDMVVDGEMVVAEIRPTELQAKESYDPITVWAVPKFGPMRRIMRNFAGLLLFISAFMYFSFIWTKLVANSRQS